MRGKSEDRLYFPRDHLAIGWIGPFTFDKLPQVIAMGEDGNALLGLRLKKVTKFLDALLLVFTAFTTMPLIVRPPPDIIQRYIRPVECRRKLRLHHRSWSSAAVMRRADLGNLRQDDDRSGVRWRQGILTRLQRPSEWTDYYQIELKLFEFLLQRFRLGDALFGESSVPIGIRLVVITIGQRLPVPNEKERFRCHSLVTGAIFLRWHYYLEVCILEDRNSQIR